MEQGDLERATSVPLPLSPEPVVNHAPPILSTLESLPPIIRDPVNENSARSEVEAASDEPAGDVQPGSAPSRDGLVVRLSVHHYIYSELIYAYLLSHHQYSLLNR